MPDLIISDYRLREQRTGAQAITELRAKFGLHLPAILITGDTAPERLAEARASGIPLLHKPLAPAQLQRLVAELLFTEPTNTAATATAATTATTV
jgi:CheY-like chemotaxis protein